MRLMTVAVALMTMMASAQAAPNAESYSYKVWPEGALPRHGVQTASTPFGKLTCSGGGGISMRSGAKKYAAHHRNCHW